MSGTKSDKFEFKNAQEVYEESLIRVKKITGLEDLSLIEKVALRRISSEVWARSMIVVEAIWEFPPVSEAVAVFLEGYYDTPCSSQTDIIWLNNIRRISAEHRIGVAEFFRKKQREKHVFSEGDLF